MQLLPSAVAFKPHLILYACIAQMKTQCVCLCIHTHICFREKWGHPIMVFILYKLYVLLPYTLHLNLALTGDCALLLQPPPSKKKTHSAWFISVLKSGDMGQCPHKSPSRCNSYVIPVSLYKSMSSFITKICTHTHTHTLLKYIISV